MLSILTCQLSSIGSKTLGQGSRNLLSAAIGVRPQFRVSLRRVYELVTPVLKYPAVHRQKAWLHFSPPTLVERYHQLLPHEISCMGLLVHFAFLYRTPPPPPPNSPNRDWYLMMSQSCLATWVSIAFSPFLPPSLFLMLQFIWAVYLGITNYRVGAALISSMVWCFITIICTAVSGKIQINNSHVKFCLWVVLLSIWFLFLGLLLDKMF